MIDADVLAKHPELATECWCGDDRSVHGKDGKDGCYKGTCTCKAYVPKLAAPRMLELLRESCRLLGRVNVGEWVGDNESHDLEARLESLLTELGADKP